jgi:hypothetical protein
MIEKELLFNYHLNINDIFNLCINDNDVMIKRIKEVVNYKQGEWKNNIKKDIIVLKLENIPKEIPEKILKLILNKDGTIINKIKIKIIDKTANFINLKIKVKPVANFLFKINDILKLTSIKANILLTQTGFKISIINSKYKIKLKNITENVDFIEKYIEELLNKLLINNMTSYLTEIEEKLKIA